MLQNMSDAAIRLAGGWWLIGYVCGMVTLAIICWRPLTRSRHEADELRILRQQRDDADRQLSAALQAADRMAQMVAASRRGSSPLARS